MTPPFAQIQRKPGGPRVALADRVRGNQAKAPSRLEQRERAPEEVRSEVGVAVGLRDGPTSTSPDSRRRVPSVRVFLPANGGLPTITSKPPRRKTSGNSISQWNGVTPAMAQLVQTRAKKLATLACACRRCAEARSSR